MHILKLLGNYQIIYYICTLNYLINLQSMKKQIISFICAAILATGCSDDNAVTPEVVENPADMVVYGTIYTVEDDAPKAEAFAVKDGKYIYVGDEKGVKAYVGEKNHRG